MHKTGKGPNLVFFHGGAIRYNSYKPLINELSRHFTVYYFNLPGHGAEVADADPEHAIEQIEENLRQENIENPVFVGHSLGGFYAFEIARRGYKVQEVVLFDPVMTKIKQKRSNFIVKFLLEQPVKNLLSDYRSWRFILAGTIDVLKNLFLQGTRVGVAMRLLLNILYCNKSIYDGSFKLRTLHGKDDSLIKYEDFDKSLKSVTTLVPGEHMWPMCDVKETVKKVLEVCNF